MLLLLYEVPKAKGNRNTLTLQIPEAKKIGVARNWKWGVQAMRGYLKISKTRSYIPYEKETEAYNPKERQTVTIINSNQPAKLKYLENSFPVKR